MQDHHTSAAAAFDPRFDRLVEGFHHLVDRLSATAHPHPSLFARFAKLIKRHPIATAAIGFAAVGATYGLIRARR